MIGLSLRDADVLRIIKNNCGTPPEKKKLEYHIWLNQSKLDFYREAPLYKGIEQSISQQNYLKLIQAGRNLLEKLYPASPSKINKLNRNTVTNH